MNQYYRIFLLSLLLIFTNRLIYGQDAQSATSSQKTIFVYGGQINKSFVSYIALLTGEDKPKICFLPTATGDSERYINYWYELCNDLPVIPYVLRVWISSYSQEKTFEEILLEMDAIVVGGGNTLNMIAIWKAQGIDDVLKTALDKGIVLAGGSAGSLCWFLNGTTDSRPKELSIVEGLGFLKYSHCPHYSSEESRRPLYHKNILSGDFLPGYACDDQAGIVFKNGEFAKAVSLNKENNSYFVSVENGEITEQKLDPEIIE